MTETLPRQEILDARADHELSSSALFARQVDRMESLGVEFDRKPLVQAGETLIQGHGLKPEFFKDPARSAMFLGVANKLSQIEGEDQAEVEHIYDVLTLLAGEDSAFSKVFQDSRNDNEKISEERHAEIIAKFSNKEVARDLKDRISEDGLLDRVREQMGIDEESEQQYEICVLNITPSSDEPDQNYRKRYGVDDNGEWTQEQDIIDQDDDRNFEEYKEGLIEKAEEFRGLMKLDRIPGAWFKELEGKPTIFLPLPLAERLAYPKEPYRQKYWDGVGSTLDIATLRHEYSHTQAKMHSKVGYLGIGLEELKAEHYSGDRLGYNDIKKHFQMLGIVSGYNIKDIFRASNKDAPLSSQAFYEELAKTGGLDALYDVTISIPHGYCTEGRSSKLLSEIVKTSGGQDGIQEQAWKRVVEKEGEDVVIRRLEEYIDWAKATAKRIEELGGQLDSFEFFLNYGGASYLTRKIEEIYEVNPRTEDDIIGQQSLAGTEKIGLPQGQPITREEDIERIVEEPAREACIDLFRKNVLTISASAHDDEKVPYIDIDVESLSGANATALQTLIKEGKAELIELRGDNRSQTAKIKVDGLTDDKTSEQISHGLLELTSKFTLQPLARGFYKLDELTKLYGYTDEEPTEVSVDDFVDQGFVFDEKTGLLFESQELIEQYRKGIA